MEKANKNKKQTKVKPYELKEPESMTVNEPIEWVQPGLQLDFSRRYSYADYLTWNDGRMREIINGFVSMFSAPNELHARLTSNWLFISKLFVRNKKGKCRIYHAPFDVRLSPTGETDDDKIFSVIQPDVTVICDLSKIDSKGCLGAPDLIVEVESPSSTKKDMIDKFRLYETNGVKEYWIILPRDRRVCVFLLQDNGKYDIGTCYEYGEKVPVRLFKGLDIDLKELFGED